MILFGKKLEVETVKKECLQRLNQTNPKVTDESKTRCVIEVNTKGRTIYVNLNTFGKKSVTVDVIDPFGFVRIPRTVLKKDEDLQMFLMVQLCKIINEYVK